MRRSRRNGACCTWASPERGSGSTCPGRWPGRRAAGGPGGAFAFGLHRLYGDANGDRTVNAADLTLFRNVFGAVTTDPTFDFNGDGVINAADLNRFRTNFGAGL